jgi:PAS domain S-box-containing protein
VRPEETILRPHRFTPLVDRHPPDPAEALPMQPEPAPQPPRPPVARHQPLGRDDIFFAAVEMTRMPMLVTDPNRPDNPVVFANHAFLQLTGYTAEEVIGRNCRFLQGPGTDPEAINRMREALQARTDFAIEVLNYRKDGRPFWNALFVSPVFDAEGRLLYHFGSQLDVTRRREAEAALRRAQRMEALGQLTGGLAHDFNNLLQVVTGSLEMLRPLVEEGDNPRARRRHEGALEATRRGATLTRQLLAFARRQRLDGRATDVNATLTGMAELLARSLGPGLRVKLDLAPALPPARLDAGQLEAGLLNLLFNARDAMPDGGEAVITTRLLGDAEATCGSAPDEDTSIGGGFVEVAVRDQGVGIPPEIIDRVTEPFFTTKDVGRGSGLGLAQVYGFVRQSGGNLRIESAPGAGTIVRLRFPALPTEDMPAHAPRQAHRASPEPQGGGESILIVEDNPEVLELAESVLSDLGYRVTTACDGPSALRLLDDPAFAIDLLFSDVVMPGGINGIRLATEARKQRPWLRVLLSTGFVDPREEMMSSGPRPHGFPVVPKPYRRAELARRVRQTLDAGPSEG